MHDQPDILEQGVEIAAIQRDLQGQFTVGWYMLLPVVLVIGMVLRRVPALPALLIGALAGAVFAALFQQETVLRFVGEIFPEPERSRLDREGGHELRYEIHRHAGENWVFVSALLFRHAGLHLQSMPFARLSY